MGDNIRGKSCRLPAPWSGSTSSRDIFRRRCQCALHALSKHSHMCGMLYKLTTQDECANADYTPTVGKTQLSSVQEDHRTEESSVTFTMVGLRKHRLSQLTGLSVVKDELSEFVCKKCVIALEKAEDALRLQKEVVTSLSATTLRHQTLLCSQSTRRPRNLFHPRNRVTSSNLA